MIPYVWVLPVPSTRRRWTIEIPHGAFYEELVWGAVSELLDERVAAASDDEELQFRDAILRILDSVVEQQSGGNSVQFFQAHRTTNQNEQLPANAWTLIQMNQVVGASLSPGGAIEIPASGMYSIQWAIYARLGAQSTSRLLINGIPAANGMGIFAGTASGIPATSLLGAAFLELSAGDFLSIEAYSRSGGELAAPSLYPNGTQVVALVVAHGAV